MNIKALKQIVEESKDIPDGTLRFETWYSDHDGVVTMCPIGNHILKHPELMDRLKVETDSRPYNGSTRSAWHISSFSIAKYLDISQAAVDCLFVYYNKTREEFVANVIAFIDGETDIRECCGPECNDVYVTTPDAKGSVCDFCREQMLEMCGM